MGVIEWLNGWEKIEDLPGWINKNRLGNKGIVKGRTFVYKYDNHYMYIDNHGHGGYLGTGEKPDYYRKVR